MTLYTYSICSLADAKAWLGITDGTSDAVLTNLINVVTDLIEEFMGQYEVVRSATQTEKFNGDGATEYRVLHPPINTLTDMAIAIEGHTAPVVINTDQVRVDLEAGVVYLLQDSFAAGYPQNCSVTYKPGRTVARSIVWQVCLDEVKRCYKDRDANREPIQSISVEGQSVTYYREMGLSEDAREKLRRGNCCIVRYA